MFQEVQHRKKVEKYEDFKSSQESRNFVDCRENWLKLLKVWLKRPRKELKRNEF